MIASLHRMTTALSRRLGATTAITLTWREWPDGKPAVDTTTGAARATPQSQPAVRTCAVEALFHSVAPTKAMVRMYSEIRVGDAILDFICGLQRITAAGDTGLTAGAVLSQFAFNAANRALATGATPATGTAADLESLESLFFTIADQKWTQAEIGEELSRSWDTVFGVTRGVRSILVRRLP